MRRLTPETNRGEGGKKNKQEGGGIMQYFSGKIRVFIVTFENLTRVMIGSSMRETYAQEETKLLTRNIQKL